MGKVNFTKNQQNAIDAKTSNILVSAAAGSGKTAVLSERVIKMLTRDDNPIEANRLVIVTFTVLAAEEMRQRIAKKLNILIELNPTNRQLQMQQLMLASAKICTIHSLCSSLIRENFQKLGLSPDFRVADETELTIIKNDAVDEVLGKFYDEKSVEFLDLVEFICVKNDNPLVSAILSIYDFIRSFPFPKKFLVQSLMQYENAKKINDTMWYKIIKTHVIDALNTAVLEIQNTIDLIEFDEQIKPAYLPSLDSDIAQIGAILEKLAFDNWDEAVMLCCNFSKLQLKPVRKYEDKDFLKEIQERRKSAIKIVETIAKKYLNCTQEQFTSDILKLYPVVEILYKVVTNVYDLIEEKKSTNAVIDYADLEHYTLKLLLKEGTTAEKSDVGIELSESFDEIMIDECQDINEVQNYIFKLLSKGEHNIFMVGDVKQSIYRFRKAMPSLFIEKKQSFAEYNEKTHETTSCANINLEHNFRSRKEVCDTVNLIFSQIMSGNMGEIEYDSSEYLVPAAKFQPNDQAYSEVHIIDMEEESDRKKTEVEAQYIANLIKEKIDNEYKIEENGQFRTAKYGDFAILLRAKKDKSKIYAAALNDSGISCFSDATDGYFNEYEIAVTLNLLRIIDNPLIDISLVSVLMSPMFCFDADSIVKIRLEKRKEPLYMSMVLCAENGDKSCEDFIDAIAKLREISVVSTVEEIVQAIYDKTGFVSSVYAMGNGEQRDANLRLLLTYANKYESMGSCGLSGFLRYIDRVIRNKQDFSCANTMTKNSNTVKIMSVHSSKGLEFPVCILADCAKGFNLMDLKQSYQLNAKQGFGMKIVEKIALKKYNNFPYEAVALATLKETISEEMRVLYVALTRAKEKLIMVMSMPKPIEKIKTLTTLMGDNIKLSSYAVFSERSYASWILMSILRHPTVDKFGINGIKTINTNADIRLFLTNATDIKKEEFDEKIVLKSDIVDENIARKLDKTFQFKYKNDTLTKIPAKLTATQISKKDETGIINLKVNPTFLQEQSLTPAMKGTILHSFMQYANFENAKISLQDEINRLEKEGFLSSQQIKALDCEKITSFLESNLYRKIQDADSVLREFKFLYFIKAEDVYEDIESQFKQNEILIQGIADCIIIKNNKATIIDYKTDITASEQVLVERYKRQLEIYKSAITKSLEIEVESCKIYSLHLKKDIEV